MARTTLPPQADEAAQTPKAETPQTAAESSLPLPTPTPMVTLWTPPIGMIARIMSLACLILSVSLLASNSTTIRFNGLDLDLDLNFTATFHFNDVYAYRYALSSGVIGLTYTLLLLLSSIHQLRSGKLPDPKFLIYEFLGDKVILVLLATGVGAAFGATVDLKSSIDQFEDAIELYGQTTILAPIVSKFDDFFNRAYIPAIFLLFAFLSSGVSSILSSLALTKKNPT